MSFHEVSFPEDLSEGSIGGPEFKTEVVVLASGHEKRNQNWTYERERWQVAYGVKTVADLQALLTFFKARRGRLHGFRFKNPDDFTATLETLGTGDGSTTEFQLVKTYSSGGETHTREITKPVSGTVDVFLDSVQQSESEVSVDTTTGIVTFSAAPSSGEVVTATFEFDVPVRFDTDHLPINLTTYLARSADVPLIEIRQ